MGDKHGRGEAFAVETCFSKMNCMIRSSTVRHHSRAVLAFSPSYKINCIMRISTVDTHKNRERCNAVLPESCGGINLKNTPPRRRKWLSARRIPVFFHGISVFSHRIPVFSQQMSAHFPATGYFSGSEVCSRGEAYSAVRCVPAAKHIPQ